MLVAALGIFHANHGVWLKRLEKDRFPWPNTEEQARQPLKRLLYKEFNDASSNLVEKRKHSCCSIFKRIQRDRYSDIDYYCLIHKNSMQEIMDKRKKLVTLGR
jgi:hypothetical protein